VAAVLTASVSADPVVGIVAIGQVLHASTAVLRQFEAVSKLPEEDRAIARHLLEGLVLKRCQAVRGSAVSAGYAVTPIPAKVPAMRSRG
jgi:hypothetical protein